MINEAVANQLSWRVIKGGFWVFALRITQQVFNLIRLIILARLLAPTDFGLMGIALLAMAILETFSETGFQQALIQKREDIESYLNSAWTVIVLRGLVLFGILYLSAPFVATFFESPSAEPVIQVIGLSALFQAFTNIGVIYFQKELEFNRQFFYELSGTLTDFIVAVSSALILKNVWALVLGLLAGNFVRCLMSYFVHPYRPRVSFDWERAKELWEFGRWVLGSSILVFLVAHGDDILVGKMLGATALGFYQMAYIISNLPATEITHIISTVSFPAYSKLQGRPDELRHAYLKVFQATTLLSVPLAGGILLLSSDFTRLFLGEKWLPIIPAIQILTLWGLIRSIGATAGPLFKAVRRPDLAMKVQFLRLIILAILVYPFTFKWGIVGTSLAVTLSALLVNPITDYLTIEVIKCRTSEFLRIVAFPILLTSIMLGVFLVVKKMLLPGTELISFFLLLFTGAVVYVGSFLILGRYMGTAFKIDFRVERRAL